MSFQISGSIKLIAPILFNSPLASVAAVDSGQTGRRRTKAQKVDEAHAKLHRTPSGLICIPRDNFKRCIILGAGSGNFKEGKRGLGAYLEATVFLDNDLIFDTAEPDEIHEHWGRIPPRTGALALLRRPLMKVGRTLDFAMTVFDDRRDPAELKLVVQHAGVYVGLGAWRPNFGRFIVERWDVTKT
jgi:hypothetical protein